jgi:hypothetical protein
VKRIARTRIPRSLEFNLKQGDLWDDPEQDGSAMYSDSRRNSWLEIKKKEGFWEK